MLNLDLQRVFKLKAITRPYSFLTAHGFTHHTAYRLANGKCRSISLRHLEKLCRILHCEPHDLLAYVPEPNAMQPANDPLAFLQRHEAEVVDIHALMSGLSPQQMLELSAELAQRYRLAS
jgi:hypothetical protein